MATTTATTTGTIFSDGNNEESSGEFDAIKAQLRQSQNYGSTANTLHGDDDSDTTPKKAPKVVSAEDKKTNKRRRLLIVHICVLAFLDMTAYAMCLVPFTSLLKQLSIVNVRIDLYLVCLLLRCDVRLQALGWLEVADAHVTYACTFVSPRNDTRQGGGGSTSSAQSYQTTCVVLTSVFAFIGGPLIGGISDSFGRFPGVIITRFMRIVFALCLVFVDQYRYVAGIEVLLFVGCVPSSVVIYAVDRPTHSRCLLAQPNQRTCPCAHRYDVDGTKATGCATAL